MASSARIDELRKKFDENPRRYFAPLANEYRKIGDFDQAIFICQEYLPQQPGHMSGHIVYGQALFETGRLDEARIVFETALTLDPENLIALRHLGDIAHGSGDAAAARSWYQRVLEADPRNEEIAALLNTLLSQPEATGQARAEPAAEPPGQVASMSRHTPAWGDTPAAPARPVSALPTLADVVADAPPDSATDMVIEWASEGAAPLDAAPPQSQEPAHVAPEPAPVVPPSEHELFDISDMSVGDEMFSSDKVSPPAIDLGPIPGIETAETLAAETAALFEADPLAVTGFHDDAVAPDPETALAFESSAPPDDPNRAHSDSDTPFVTETMAELYLQQGHRREAASIYRKLIEQRPADAALRDRLAALEPSDRHVPEVEAQRPPAAPSGPSIRLFLRELLWDWKLAAPAPDAPAVVAPAVVAPAVDAPAVEASWADAPLAGAPDGDGLGSVDALFPGPRSEPDEAMAALLSTAYRLDDQTGGPLRGVPAHRATGELSLEHVFGGQSEFDVAPAQRAPTLTDRGFFDQFFAGSVSPQGDDDAEALPSDDQVSPTEDIEQFNSWLQGLKNT